jgi:hypothetical protein
MGKCKKHPKNHIVSIRITDEELVALASTSNDTNKSISDLMREALHKIVLSPESCYDSYDKGGIRV